MFRTSEEGYEQFMKTINKDIIAILNENNEFGTFENEKITFDTLEKCKISFIN
jgi:hypothetical protein